MVALSRSTSLVRSTNVPTDVAASVNDPAIAPPATASFVAPPTAPPLSSPDSPPPPPCDSAESRPPTPGRLPSPPSSASRLPSLSALTFTVAVWSSAALSTAALAAPAPSSLTFTVAVSSCAARSIAAVAPRVSASTSMVSIVLRRVSASIFACSDLTLFVLSSATAMTSCVLSLLNRWSIALIVASTLIG